MAKAERLKEEIGWQKVVFAVYVALDASLVARLAQNYVQPTRYWRRRVALRRFFSPSLLYFLIAAPIVGSKNGSCMNIARRIFLAFPNLPRSRAYPSRFGKLYTTGATYKENAVEAKMPKMKPQAKPEKMRSKMLTDE